MLGLAQATIPTRGSNLTNHIWFLLLTSEFSQTSPDVQLSLSLRIASKFQGGLHNAEVEVWMRTI